MAESSGLVTVVGDDGKTYVADQKTVVSNQAQQMVAQGGAFKKKAKVKHQLLVLPRIVTSRKLKRVNSQTSQQLAKKFLFR